MPHIDKLLLAREIVRAERGLARLPKPENRMAVELSQLPDDELVERHAVLVRGVSNDQAKVEAVNFGAPLKTMTAGDFIPQEVCGPEDVFEYEDRLQANLIPPIETTTDDDPVVHSLLVTERLRDRERRLNREMVAARAQRGVRPIEDRMPVIAKKTPFGRLLTLRTKIIAGVQHILHPTKGWRKV